MSIPIYSNMNMKRNKVKDFALDGEITITGENVDGQLYYNTSDQTLYIYCSTISSWLPFYDQRVFITQAYTNGTYTLLDNNNVSTPEGKHIYVIFHLTNNFNGDAKLTFGSQGDIILYKNYYDKFGQNEIVSGAVYEFIYNNNKLISIGCEKTVADSNTPGVVKLADNLTTQTDGFALSSKQGKILNDRLVLVEGEINGIGGVFSWDGQSNTQNPENLSLWQGIVTKSRTTAVLVYSYNSVSDNKFVTILYPNKITASTTTIVLKSLTDDTTIIEDNTMTTTSVKSSSVTLILNNFNLTSVSSCTNSVQLTKTLDPTATYSTPFVPTQPGHPVTKEYVDNRGSTSKYVANITGNGSTVAFTVTHNLGTKDFICEVYEVGSPYEKVLVDIQHTTNNTTTLVFNTAPALDTIYKLVIIS